MEEWRNVAGYEQNYLVSDMGRVMSKATGKILKACVSGPGYLTVSLCKKGDQTTYYVHRLVATAFVENPQGLPVVDHIDGNRLNNLVGNLRFCEPKNNAWNARKRAKHCSSPYKGISFDKRRGKWEAKICCEGVRTHLGYFKHPAEAALAYNRAARNKFGDYAFLNVVVDEIDSDEE
jgi:hypothetical protein